MLNSESKQMPPFIYSVLTSFRVAQGDEFMDLGGFRGSLNHQSTSRCHRRSLRRKFSSWLASSMSGRGRYVGLWSTPVATIRGMCFGKLRHLFERGKKVRIHFRELEHCVSVRLSKFA